MFSAFYIDHSQNEFLQHYFVNELPSCIKDLKHALDIVQHLLSKSDITEQEELFEQAVEVQQQITLE